MTMPPKIVDSTEVYYLPLKDDGSPDVPGGYIYLAPKSADPITIRFAIEGTSSICRHGTLWVNVPKKDKQYHKDVFQEFKLEPDFNRTIELDVVIYGAGPFAFYTTYTPLPPFGESGHKSLAATKTPLYYIDVAPRLTLDGRLLPIPALSVFSLISKFVGTYPKDWEKHLRGIGEGGRGYNMIHFPPLQVRGISNSPYSLYDQLGWDPTCFPNGEKDVAELVETMETKHGLLGLTDVVWNHTANNSAWLQEHPDAGYNICTAPWLESASVFDEALLKFGADLRSLGYPTDIKSNDDLINIMNGVKQHVIGATKLWEYYVIDVEKNTEDIVNTWSKGGSSQSSDTLVTSDSQTLKQGSRKDQADFLRKTEAITGVDRLGERFRRHVDPVKGAALLTILCGPSDSNGTDIKIVRDSIKNILNEINLPFYREYDEDVGVACQQLFDRVKYVRLDEHGPKLGPITDKDPLFEPYFTRLPENVTTKQHQKGSLALVNNGWIWGQSALNDSAGPQSKAYLRREVIIWGDCVKLRYGKSRDDSPFLWDYMAKYTKLMAKYFAGFRIDNCHSTPVHVAEYLLDEARRVRPNLFVVAELFTGSEEVDYVFVKRLGLSALIREAMQAWSTGELSRLVHRHGGRPIGSFEIDEISGIDKSADRPTSNGVRETREVIRKIRQTPIQALFMDCTHDNETPAQKRDARDTLPTAALVSMCSSASGSVMGFDEIYPKLVDLVQETRLYKSASSDRPYGKPVEIGPGEGGIGGIKKLLNQIHTIMGKDAYDETHIHHDEQYITVHRVHPQSRRGYFLIAHTAFPGYGNGNGGLQPINLVGTRVKHLGSWSLEVDDSQEARDEVASDKKYLRGLPSKVVETPGVRWETKGDETVINVRDKFPPGSIALFETWTPSAEHSSGLDTYVTSGAKAAFAELDLTDLNLFLYRCNSEELDYSDSKDSVYSIPGYGELVYAGLQGWWSLLKHMIAENNLAHPLCEHLRQGQWPLDYIVGRLERIAKISPHEKLVKPTTWLRERFDAIRKIPSFLLPRYFGLVVRTAYMAAFERSISLMNENVQKGQWFLQSLAMVSIQQTGFVKTASLWPQKSVRSLAAGLPHFSVQWGRCWGRDVFISLRGLFLGTGRYNDAKEHICAFASVVKHGMIPNLLNSGDNPRYNSRDSIWFMLQTIQDYTKIVPNGLDILKEEIPRRFLPYDDTWFPSDDPRAYSKTCTLESIIQECMQRHAVGMSFREANAGPEIDGQMSDNGFNIKIGVDWNTGILFGGNKDNCGTWMDKMGESTTSGSKGVPGTPRDGAAVEITGLLYSTLRWLAQLHADGQYKYAGVSTETQELNSSNDQKERKIITYFDWADKIKDNFERCYWIPSDASEDSKYDVNSKIVNRRGIYKDLYKSSKEYEDYQLRPNFPIAMTVAPSLFDDEHALQALQLADKVLRGPTGMATLDPSDLNYRPYYNNSEDSTDFATSKGRNYHQGPEWLWPTGFFLRALLKFDLKRCKSAAERTEAFQQITRRLAGCKQAIVQSPWAGLAELTQKDGAECGDSSPTQAWSASCLIDLYHDAAQYDVSQLSR